MRVVHIQSGGFYDGWTYQENLLTKWQHKNGHDVIVITTRWSADNKGKAILVSEDKYDYINDDGVRIIRLPLTGTDQYSFGYDELYSTIDNCKPDVLFIHGVTNNTKALIKYLSLHKNVIAYADSHSDFSNSAPFGKYDPRFQAYRLSGFSSRESKRLIPYVKKFYGVLPARVDYLSYVYRIPKEKCELLLMGADDELVSEARNTEVKQSIRNMYDIEPDDFLVMTGGKIDSFKAQTLLLMQAVKNIDNQHVKLIVFGPVSDELKEKFDALVDGTKIQHIGYVEGKETYKHFAASELVVFPGRHSVFWEQAAGLGLPMLCKEWEGTKHVDLGGNVRFLKHDSVKEIQSEIQRLLNNPEEYKLMKSVAEREGMKTFSYRNIALQSLEE
ncbi:MAG: glycosyltransferase family 4 protein [Synergistaceae bacterium]|nr:glycosyltransferase family 4 protein [Synergistaceae bacterium]